MNLARTGGDLCPHCGTALQHRRRLSHVNEGEGGRGVRRGVAASGGAGVAVAIEVHHDNQVTAQHRRAAAAARVRAAAAAQAQAAQQAQQAARQAQQAAEVTARQGVETQLQTNITNDVMQKFNQGLLTNGPITTTSCTPISGGSSLNLSGSTGTYSCIAVYQTNSDGTQSGLPL